MAGENGNRNQLDPDCLKSAVETIREQLEIGLEAYAEVERLHDCIEEAVRLGKPSPAVQPRVLGGEDLTSEVLRFVEALKWLRLIETSGADAGVAR